MKRPEGNQQDPSPNDEVGRRGPIRSALTTYTLAKRMERETGCLDREADLSPEEKAECDQLKSIRESAKSRLEKGAEEFLARSLRIAFGRRQCPTIRCVIDEDD
jgi:hypothetical protein